jgi:hypothetical protein
MQKTPGVKNTCAPIEFFPEYRAWDPLYLQITALVILKAKKKSVDFQKIIGQIGEKAPVLKR